jgi:hypothetical protein
VFYIKDEHERVIVLHDVGIWRLWREVRRRMLADGHLRTCTIVLALCTAGTIHDDMTTERHYFAQITKQTTHSPMRSIRLPTPSS